MRFEKGAVHLVEQAVLAGELRRAKGAARVDDHVALDHLKPDLSRHRFEMFDRPFHAAAPEIHIPVDPLQRRFRMQLEWQPRHPDKMLLLELFDSDRVDVAPGSNVVGEDDELDRLGCSSHLLMQNRGSKWAIPGAPHSLCERRNFAPIRSQPL
jgi:hypothetical protein